MQRLTHDMTTMTTPTIKGGLPGWSVSLVGPGEYPRYTSAVKDGTPWVAQATHKAAKHHRITTGTRSTAKLSHQNMIHTSVDSSFLFVEN